MKRSASLLVSMALCMTSLSPAQAQGDPDLDPTGGGTVVTVEGRIVEVTVNIDVVLPEGFSELDPYIQSRIREGFSDAAAIWNEAFRKSLANGCYSVELSLAIRFVAANMASGGGHDMHVLTRNGIPRFESPQLTTETTNDDTAEVFTTNGTLYLPTWALESPSVLAHELGHVFGLGDDYTRHANGTVSSLPGRERTLMDDGFVIDQALIDRIGDLARRSGAQLPQCWKGTASIATSAVYPEGGTSCQDGWELEFTFVASAEGTIDGQGTADLRSTPTCSFPIDPTPWQDHAEYRVLGEETAGGFSLRFALAPPGFTPSAGAQVGGIASIFSVPASPSGGSPVEIAVSGNSGTGQGVWRFESTVTLTANGTVTIGCVSCEDSAG